MLVYFVLSVFKIFLLVLRGLNIMKYYLLPDNFTKNIIGDLDNFARDNSFLSIIILGILGSLLYDILKKIFRFFLLKSITGLRNTTKKISKKAYKNTQYLLEHYKEELKTVEKLKENDKEVLTTLLGELYNIFLWIIILIVFCLLIDKFSSDYAFYGFLGSSSTIVLGIIHQLFYNSQLFQKAKKFDSYKIRVQKRISLIESILDTTNK